LTPKTNYTLCAIPKINHTDGYVCGRENCKSIVTNCIEMSKPSKNLTQIKDGNYPFTTAIIRWDKNTFGNSQNEVSTYYIR